MCCAINKRLLAFQRLRFRMLFFIQIGGSDCCSEIICIKPVAVSSGLGSAGQTKFNKGESAAV